MSPRISCGNFCHFPEGDILTFLMRGFLYDLIFLRAMAPGLYLWYFLTPAVLVVVGDLFCLVLAMAKTQMILMSEVGGPPLFIDALYLLKLAD